MPEICRFYGIIIGMFFDDHNPPHFHARYGKEKVAVEINSLRVLEGRIPPRALGLVMEWASQHQSELLQNWELAKNNQPPEKIASLA
ncbi:MAG: transcriptional regulator [Deltaproteobacteria bacterium CG_4_8_14_3_um_filter_45_9]|nr:MAG: transcriptional regulator [Deltaproteobacteria bacterium CG03_land_8_20_14_0_80_45_14]PIX25156.1 MAG: transcriptional regulator [Deltaproteobacteria bacterium CG_4_8_14_3_um_filter_45_9]